jgi:hypothetical protein
MDANGDRKQPKTEILAGKQESQEIRRGKEGLFVFSCCFLFSCYVGDLGALEGSKRPFSAGKQEICTKTGEGWG